MKMRHGIVLACTQADLRFPSCDTVAALPERTLMKHNPSIALHHKLAAAAMAVAWMALPLPALAQYHHGPPPPHYDHHDYHGHYDNHYHYDDHHDDSGAIVAGALLGVAAGVAISNANTPQPPPTVVYTSPPPPPPPGVVYYNDGY